MARILLQYFNPDYKDCRDQNAIWFAVAHCDEDLIRLLLELQSDIWMMDCRRTTPLNLAIYKGNLRITQLLHHSEVNPSHLGCWT